MEQFVHQQTVAIFQRLLSTQTDNDEARHESLLKLLADEEAKSIVSSQHGVPSRSAITNARQRGLGRRPIALVGPAGLEPATRPL